MSKMTHSNSWTALGIAAALVGLVAGCNGPSPDSGSSRTTAAPDAGPTDPGTGLDGTGSEAGMPATDGAVAAPGAGSGLSPEYQSRLDARTVDYSAALRTASLELRGELPSLVDINALAEAPDDASKQAAYNATIEAYLDDPAFTGQMLAYFRNTLKMGGDPDMDTAPLFAAELVVQDRPFTDLFTATSGTCPTMDGSGNIVPADCMNGAPNPAGILTNPAVMKQYFSHLAFRRVRWVQETFACNPFPAEVTTPTDIGGAAPYTSPWPFESIAGADNGGRVDFHDTSSVVCANCHTSINHIAPLFGHFDDQGQYQSDFAVQLPSGDPVMLSDWLPSGETTAWRLGVPAPDLPSLGRDLAADPQVDSCTVARLWNWALGKGDVVQDREAVPDSVIRDMVATYQSNGKRVKPILRAIFTSNDFVRY